MTQPDETASVDDLVAALRDGQTILGGSPLHRAMHGASQTALRVAAEMNTGYREPAELRALLAELTGGEIDETVTVFPPFRADFGRNIRFGRGVFINMGCTFQDQGGITIGDRAQIGHNTVIATLNHDFAPDRRADMHPAPVVIGADVRIGSNATILPGVTIGDGAVIGAASVVTKDVPAGMMAVGSPARVIRSVV